MTYKAIFSGRFEFGNARSFEQVLKVFEHRNENHYRSEILFKAQDIFCEESAMLDLPRLIVQATEKQWKNSINMLKVISEFAIAGDMSAWMTDNGKVLHHELIEPHSDKSAVRNFLHGRELIDASGREAEAKEALSQAIEKFERHALAYERRGFVNYKLKNFADALYDYNKSTEINPGKADPHLGKALVYMAENHLSQALAELERAIQKAMPLESVHWLARRLKADCHYRRQEFESAVKELELFVRRSFRKEDVNHGWRRRAFFSYGQALLALNRVKEADAALEQALKISEGAADLSDVEITKLRRERLLEAAGQAH